MPAKLKFYPLKKAFCAGFAPIEFLTAVTITSFLAIIIFSNVKNMTKDAAIQNNLYEVRNAGELSYLRQGDYSAICNEKDRTLSDNAEFGRLEEAIKRNNGSKDVSCFLTKDKTGFVVSSPSSIEPNTSWCVESSGALMKINCRNIVSPKCRCAAINN